MEVVGLKGERIADASFGDGDACYLAWRDDSRIHVRGYPSTGEAEEARAGLREGVESTVRQARTYLEWFDEAADAGLGKSGKARERVNHG